MCDCHLILTERVSKWRILKWYWFIRAYWLHWNYHLQMTWLVLRWRREWQFQRIRECNWFGFLILIILLLPESIFPFTFENSYTALFLILILINIYKVFWSGSIWVSKFNSAMNGIASSLKLLVFTIFLFICKGRYERLSQDKMNVSKPIADFCVEASNEHQPE